VQAVEAHVERGHVVVDTPTELPDGAETEAVTAPAPRRPWSWIPPLVTVVAVWGCGRDHVVHPPATGTSFAVLPRATPSTLPTVASAAVSSPAPRASTGVPAPAFALVTLDRVKLHRLLTGAAIASTSGGLVFALASDGQVTRLDSVVAAIRPTVGEIGALGGSWPGTLFIERYSPKFSTIGLVVRGDPAQARVVRTWRGAYLRPAAWRDGAVLTVRADGSSAEFGSPLDRVGHFETIGHPGGPTPEFPKGALFDDAFIAYPSGRVFALGGRRTRPVVEDDASEYEEEHGYMIDGALVWQTDATGGGLGAVQLPGTTPRDRLLSGGVLAGAVDTETLAWGELEVWKNRQSETKPYLARFEASGWRQLPIDRTIRQLSRGSDGTIWAVVVGNSSEPLTTSRLERASWTSDGGLALVRTEVVPRPEWARLAAERGWWWNCPVLYPRELAVVAADDIWLTADCFSPEGMGAPLLLHTHSQRPLVELAAPGQPDRGAKVTRLLARRAVARAGRRP
jgi:hypothetical protein